MTKSHKPQLGSKSEFEKQTFYQSDKGYGISLHVWCVDSESCSENI